MKRKVLGSLLVILYTTLSAQSWDLVENLHGFITDIEIINGERYTTFKTGELLRGDSIIQTYPVQLFQETGLLSVSFWSDSICAMVCGTDSIQRVMYGSDTLLQVSYKSPWSIRHRAGDMVATDSVLYVAFGDGSYPSGAQDTSDLRGKIVAITNDSSYYLVAYGLRNPWKIDLKGDTLYIADCGAQGEEEISRIRIDSLAGPVNLGWPCKEGNIVHDTICGPLTDPLFTYPRENTGNCIIGGKWFRNGFWWCDNYYRFGGYVTDDTVWVKTPCPQYPDGMYVQGDSIYVYDYTGKIYRWTEGPLSIDTLPEDSVIPQTLIISQDEIRWGESLGGILMVLTIEGDLMAYEDAYAWGEISLSEFIPGMYALALMTPYGVQWSKLFVKI